MNAASLDCLATCDGALPSTNGIDRRLRPGRGFCTWVGLGLVWLLVGLELGAVEPQTIRSQSGQFTIQGLTLVGAPVHRAVPGSEAYLRLDPTLLAVSCERIKEGILGHLGMEDRWRDQILIGIRTVRQNDEPILVHATRYADRWQYLIQTPEHVPRDRFLKTVVRVILLEIANRPSRVHAVEFPAWLGEGLAEVIASETLIRFTLEANQGLFEQSSRRDPLVEVRRLLQARPPLTLDELNWPTPEQLEGQAGLMYASCSHLLVHELLRLRDGEKCLRRMIEAMAGHWNWQTAFFEGFQPHFNHMLDLDKWWSLVLVQNAGRALSFTWSAAESWEKFDNILSIPVEVRLKSNELPMTTSTSLQNALRQWEHRRQLPMLATKLNYLHALRLRVAQELMPLLDDYRQVIAAYLQSRSRPAPHPPGESFAAKTNDATLAAAIARLDELDQRREVLRGKMTPVTAAVPTPP